MVERLNLKLGIDYLPSQAALPAVNQVVLPIAVLTRVCAWGGWTPPAVPSGRWHLIPWLKGMQEQVSAWYQVFPLPVGLARQGAGALGEAARSKARQLG